MTVTKKPDIWMPLDIGAYLADTTHLSRDEHGALLLLLMAYWRRGGPLLANDRQLAGTVKATRGQWQRLRPVLAAFFTEEGGLWHLNRADFELEKAT
jgi:uncharacterized protein YdaU (DUF1376 family)